MVGLRDFDIKICSKKGSIKKGWEPLQYAFRNIFIPNNQIKIQFLFTQCHKSAKLHYGTRSRFYTYMNPLLSSWKNKMKKKKVESK